MRLSEMMQSNGFWAGDIIAEMMEITKNGDITDELVNEIALVAMRRSKLKFFGFTATEYALASLKWVNTSHSLSLFDKLVSDLSEHEKICINQLVADEVYKIF